MTTPPADTLRAAAAFVRDAVADGTPVLLHPGVGRALVALLTAHAERLDADPFAINGSDFRARDVADAILGQPPEHAETHAARPQDGPEAVPASPATPEARSGAQAGADDLVHQCPPPGSGLTPCCRRSPAKLPRTDRLTEDPAAVTCPTPGDGLRVRRELDAIEADGDDAAREVAARIRAALDGTDTTP